MAFKLKQENYDKRPSAEMRKLWTEAWHNDTASMPATRIEFSLRVKEILAGPNGVARRRELATWRKAREQARAGRRTEAALRAQTVSITPAPTTQEVNPDA